MKFIVPETESRTTIEKWCRRTIGVTGWELGTARVGEETSYGYIKILDWNRVITIDSDTHSVLFRLRFPTARKIQNEKL